MTDLGLRMLYLTYKHRLEQAKATGLYDAELLKIVDEIASKIRSGELTNKEAEKILGLLVKVSIEEFRIGGLESLEELIEKGALDLSYDGADSLADTVASLKAKK